MLLPPKDDDLLPTLLRVIRHLGGGTEPFPEPVLNSIEGEWIELQCSSEGVFKTSYNQERIRFERLAMDALHLTIVFVYGGAF